MISAIIYLLYFAINGYIMKWVLQNKTMVLKQRNIVFECNIFTIWNTACDASFLKHYHIPVIHFGILHFKNKETLFYSVGAYFTI